jgi:hypothetical protein
VYGVGWLLKCGKNAKQVDAVPTALKVSARRNHGLKPVATEISPRWGACVPAHHGIARVRISRCRRKALRLYSDNQKTTGKHLKKIRKCLPPTRNQKTGNTFFGVEINVTAQSNQKPGNTFNKNENNVTTVLNSVGTNECRL